MLEAKDGKAAEERRYERQDTNEQDHAAARQSAQVPKSSSRCASMA
jgi:hypothetical protein